MRYVVALIAVVAVAAGVMTAPGCSPGLGGPLDGGADAQNIGEPDSQEAYTYPGCEDAGSYGCPNLLVFSCALHKIEAKHNDGCSVGTDCVVVPFGDCVSVFACTPPAVLAADEGAFLAEASAERTKYCAGAGCMGAPSCLDDPNSYRPFCMQGRCVALIPDGGNDGGTTDGGAGDGG